MTLSPRCHSSALSPAEGPSPALSAPRKNNSAAPPHQEAPGTIQYLTISPGLCPSCWASCPFPSGLLPQQPGPRCSSLLSEPAGFCCSLIALYRYYLFL